MAQNVEAGRSAATNFSLVAWVVYGVVSRGGHWTVAAAAAFIIALAIVVHEYKNHATKIISCTTAAFFAFALTTTIAAGPMLFKNYNVFLTWSIFAIVTWVSLLIGFPFTIQYAREQTPREVWDDPRFMRINIILTVVFGVMFTINAGLGVIALMTGHLRTLGSLLPIALLTAAMVFSARYPKRHAQRLAPDSTVMPAAKAVNAND